VHVHNAGKAYEVELFDANGAIIGVETFEAAELALFDLLCRRQLLVNSLKPRNSGITQGVSAPG
jgi:hypothetical protein